MNQVGSVVTALALLVNAGCAGPVQPGKSGNRLIQVTSTPSTIAIYAPNQYGCYVDWGVTPLTIPINGRSKIAAYQHRRILWIDVDGVAADSCSFDFNETNSRPVTLEDLDTIGRTVDAAKIREEQEADRARQAAAQMRIDHPDWPESVFRSIAEHKVRIGMTPEQVTLAWGTPETVNETTTKQGRQEQWVYKSDQYVYIEGGKVSAIQSRK